MSRELRWRDGSPVTTRMREGSSPDDYRDAVSGAMEPWWTSLTYEWRDKPHRLVYDLAGEVKALQARVEQAEQESDEAKRRLARVRERCEQIKSSLTGNPPWVRLTDIGTGRLRQVDDILRVMDSPRPADGSQGTDHAD